MIIPESLTATFFTRPTMQLISRRAVLYGSAAAAVLASRSSSLLAQTRSGAVGLAKDAASSARRFTMDLRCGSLGVRVDQRRSIELAAKYGFESVTPEPDYLAKLSDTDRTDLQSDSRTSDSSSTAGTGTRLMKQPAI